MSRAALIAALALHAGQPLTPAAGRAIVEALYPDRSVDPAQFAPLACGVLTFRCESFRQVLPELHVLHEIHWLETEAHRHGLSMNPDYAAMADSEAAGAMIQLTARDGHRLVGNIRLYITRSRHTQTLHAEEDTLFLLPAYRRGRAAVRFIQYAEACLRQLGVGEVRVNSKVINSADKLMEHLGYRRVAIQLVKFLEDSHVQ